MNSMYIFTGIFLVFSMISNAEASKDFGGGDLCENRINEIAIDIAAWIKAGGSSSLSFTEGVSLEQYNMNMLRAIESAKVHCVKQGDADYPINVGNAPKVCRFDQSPDEMQIKCDYEVFMNKNLTSDSDQYLLIHHEYAGLAGVEVPEGEISTYKLSNQITEYLEEVLVKKLAVKPSKDNKPDSNQLCTIDFMKSSIEQGIKDYIEYSFESIYGDHPRFPIDKESIQISYLGLLDFEDYDFTGGIHPEHAFKVIFKSEKGSEFQIVSAQTNWPFTSKEPLHYVFSIPKLIVEEKFDQEGNQTGLKCIAKTHGGYNRIAHFINTASGKVIKSELISSNYSTLASKDIK